MTTFRYLRKTVSDYVNAIRTGTSGNALRVPVEIWRVLLARIVYKLGPWMYSVYRLSEKPMSRWGSYLDDFQIKPLMRTINREEDRGFVADKVVFFHECVRQQIATVPILAICGAGAGSQGDLKLPELRHAEQLGAVLDAHPEGLFFKPHDGTGGIGAFTVMRDAGGWRFPEGTGGPEEVLAYCRRSVGSGTLLVQPRLVNAVAIRPLMAEGGFGTVRAVTYLRQGKPQLLGACLRIVVAGNAVDNFHHGATGNFIASIDAKTGRLMRLYASRTRTWPVIYDVDVHPVTSEQVTGWQLPFWKETCELVLRGQDAFRRLHTIGWDVGITDEGPIVVEANSTYNFDILQIAFDRGFRPDLNTIVESSALHAPAVASDLAPS